RKKRRTCRELIGPSERKSHRNGSARSTMDWSRTSVNQSTIRAHLEGLVIPALPVQSAQGECRGKAKGMPREGVETPQNIHGLIAGGGPVGLTASILLSRLGVRSLLTERHPGTAVHPKARAINARSMEMYRQCGVEVAIRKAGLGPEHTGLVIWTRTLAGEEIE